MERLVRVGLLYDRYGPLLTARQREAVDLYFFQNWSLQEIASSWETSRQAVHDLLGRSVRLLEGYERRLGLLVEGEKRRTALVDCAAKIAAARAALDRDAARAGELLAQAAAAIEVLLEAEGYGG